MLLATCFIAGCTTPMPKQNPKPKPINTALSLPSDQASLWQRQQTQLASLQNYQIRATIILQFYKEKPIKLKLFWRKSGNNLQVKLFDILGGTQFQLDREAGLVTIIDQNHRVYKGTDVNQLIAGIATFAIPVSQMENWIVGLPSSNDKFHLSTTTGLPDRIDNYDTQPYWYTLYDTYDMINVPSSSFNSVLLPTELALRSSLADSISVKYMEWSNLLAN